jgi:hypothetical protein
MPYDWSLNNVVLAEELHTSLAYWQAGRAEDAFKLWKGSLIESQYLESSPGNFENMSFYDASRGEAYRDFGDPIGMAGRSLVEGLFGIHPDALAGTLTIKPGLPMSWDHASLHTPDVQFDFKRTGNTDEYTIVPGFQKSLNLVLELNARTPSIKTIIINGKPSKWENVETVGNPVLRLKCGIAKQYTVQIIWNDVKFSPAQGWTIYPPLSALGADQTYDPQKVSKGLPPNIADDSMHTFFTRSKQGDFMWWSPQTVVSMPEMEVVADNKQKPKEVNFIIQNNTADFKTKVFVNDQKVAEPNSRISESINVPLSDLIIGSNVVRINYGDNKSYQTTITNWNIQKEPQKQETINLTPYFNDQVTNIFKNKYLSPRPQSPTLQLPWQGIGDWCYPLVDANIDDSGLRKAAGDKNEFVTPQGIKFATPGKMGEKNILFTSQWDNYPKQAEVPLSGKASHAYFLMAGSTNPMQSRITNGEVVVNYTDGTSDVLELKNPQTWWPIEQDYEDDGYAFQLNAARPIRVYLKSGIAALEWSTFKGIKGFANRGIDGGAGTILDLPLNPAKELKDLQLKTIANDVVIGLMGVTLVR